MAGTKSAGAVAMLVLGSCWGAGEAQAQLRPEARLPGEFRFYEENDSWLNPPGLKTDRYYTQGIRFEKLWASKGMDAHFLPGIRHKDWCSLVCGGKSGGALVNSGIAVGQNMYTPQDISIAAAQPTERPWAGLLYVSRISRARYSQPSLKAQREDRIEVSVGMVGPASFTKEAQTEFHRLIGAGLPMGWRHQLRNEPVLQLRYDVALRWPQREGGHYDIIPRARLNVGNAVTSIETEVVGRLGWHLRGFGALSIASAPTFALARSSPGGTRRGRLGFNVFLRGGAKAIAHNITLDGNTFARNDIRIERKPFVLEVGGGFEARLGRVSVSYQLVHRSSEFETRRGLDARSQEFGSFTLTVTGR